MSNLKVPTASNEAALATLAPFDGSGGGNRGKRRGTSPYVARQARDPLTPLPALTAGRLGGARLSLAVPGELGAVRAVQVEAVDAGVPRQPSSVAPARLSPIERTPGACGSRRPSRPSPTTPGEFSCLTIPTARGGHLGPRRRLKMARRADTERTGHRRRRRVPNGARALVTSREFLVACVRHHPLARVGASGRAAMRLRPQTATA